MGKLLAPHHFQDVFLHLLVREAADYIPRGIRIPALGLQSPVDPVH